MPSVLRLRQQRQHVARDVADAIGRDEVAVGEPGVGRGSDARAVGEGERHAAGAVGGAGQRVIDDRAGGPEVALANRRGRQRQELGCRSGRLRRVGTADTALHGGFDTGEEEQLVPLDRTAIGAAEDVLVVLHLLLVVGQVEVAVAERRGRQVAEQQPLVAIGAALDLHVDGGATGHALIGVEAAGRDVDRLDRFHAGAVRLEALDPLIGGAHPVDAHDSVLVGRAVHRDLHRARRVVDAAGLEVIGLRHPGREHQQALEAAAVDRDVLDRLAGDLHLHRRRFRLQQLLGGDGDRLLDRADVQLGVDADHAVGLHDDVLRGEGLEALQRDQHLIGAGEHVGEGVGAVVSGDRLAGDVGFLLGDRDRGAGHRRRPIRR